jgi:hypothetical protein
MATEKLEKPFFVFGFLSSDARGGFSDFAGAFLTLEKAMDFICDRHMTNEIWQIVDSRIHSVIWKGVSERGGIRNRRFELRQTFPNELLEIVSYEGL